MSRLFSRLLRRLSSADRPRPPARRPRLSVELLEDRLVPTTASLEFGYGVGFILNISNVGPYGVALQCNPNNNNEAEVIDVFSKSEVFQFDKQLVKTINIQLSSNSAVDIDDSDGMPFGPGALVSLYGSGTGDTLALGGSRTVSGNEMYVAGAAPSSGGELMVDNINFQLGPAITQVTDFLPITGTDDVQTSGANVAFGGTGTKFSGLGFGAGGSLFIGGAGEKPEVQLEEYAAGATISLNESFGPSIFAVNLHGSGDRTIIAGTPVGVLTEVQTNVAPAANPASVLLEANAGPVVVNCNPSTQLTVGQQLSNGLFSTQGVQANVTVQGLANLSVLDNGNVSTAQNVRVTEKSISGTGLFGKNSAVLSYSGVANLSIDSGQLADQYTVESSQPELDFLSKITITDFSVASFRADVFVDRFSGLSLSLYNAQPLSVAELFIHTEAGESVSDPGPQQGVVDVAFGIYSSQVFYDGFTPVVM